jgi:hypothetical protein
MNHKSIKSQLRISPEELVRIDEYCQKHQRLMASHGITRDDLIALQHERILGICRERLESLGKTPSPRDAVDLLLLALDGFAYPDRTTLEESVSVLEHFAQEGNAGIWDAVFASDRAGAEGYPEMNSIARLLLVDHEFFEGLWGDPVPGYLSSAPGRFSGLIPFLKKGYDDLYSRAIKALLAKAGGSFEALLPIMISLMNFSGKEDPEVHKQVAQFFEEAERKGLKMDSLLRTDDYCCGDVLVRPDCAWTTIREAVSGIPLSGFEDIKSGFERDPAALYDLDAFKRVHRQALFEHGVTRDTLILWQHEALIAMSEEALKEIGERKEPTSELKGKIALSLAGFCCPDEACLERFLALLETLLKPENETYWDGLIMGDPLAFCGVSGPGSVLESIAVDYDIFEKPNRPVLGRTDSPTDRFGGFVMVARRLGRDDLVLRIAEAIFGKAEHSLAPILLAFISVANYLREATLGCTLLDEMVPLFGKAEANGISLEKPLGDFCPGAPIREGFKKKSLREILL